MSFFNRVVHCEKKETELIIFENGRLTFYRRNSKLCRKVVFGKIFRRRSKNIAFDGERLNYFCGKRYKNEPEINK